MIIILILIGVLGFHIIEGWPFLDCLYMTVITIFTVGFKEVRTLSPAGRIFTIFIILGGVGTAFYLFTRFAEIVYQGGIIKFLRRRKMEKTIKNLKNHYIICGHGRMGSIVREQLDDENLPYVVIDNDEEKVQELKETDICCIHGDASQEEILIKAGIRRAKALAALLRSDADNLYLVLTVKLINPSLFVFSKALEEEAERKILQIGANKVVNPYKLSGLRIAQGLIRPAVVDFMDLIIRRKELSLFMEEMVVKKDSRLTNHTLTESDIRKKSNVIVVAIKKPGEDIKFNPSPGITIDTGDTLLVLGDKEDISRFEQRFLRPGV